MSSPSPRRPALALLDISISARDSLHAWFPGLDASRTAHNVINQPYTLIKPYYGGHTPMPADERQFNLSLTWNLPAGAMGV